MSYKMSLIALPMLRGEQDKEISYVMHVCMIFKMKVDNGVKMTGQCYLRDMCIDHEVHIDQINVRAPFASCMRYVNGTFYPF